MPITEAQALEDITENLQGALFYRQERAEQFPDDERNSDAVRLIGSLLEQVPSLAGIPALLSYIDAHDAVWLQEDAVHLQEQWNRYSGRIGFDHSPASIFDYVAGFELIAAQQPVYA